jgi:hypothetical protein
MRSRPSADASLTGNLVNGVATPTEAWQLWLAAGGTLILPWTFTMIDSDRSHGPTMARPVSNRYKHAHEWHSQQAQAYVSESVYRTRWLHGGRVGLWKSSPRITTVNDVIWFALLGVFLLALGGVIVVGGSCVWVGCPAQQTVIAEGDTVPAKGLHAVVGEPLFPRSGAPDTPDWTGSDAPIRSVRPSVQAVAAAGAGRGPLRAGASSS